MKTVILTLSAFIVGAFISALIMMNMMPGMMFAKAESKFSFEDTVKKLKISAENAGWSIPFTNDLQKQYAIKGLKGMTKVTVLYFCDPKGGYKILKVDKNKHFSVMMPMGVSVYETANGKVFIAAMNIGMMSKMIGGTVEKVMSKGGARFAKSLKGIIKK